MAAERNVKLDHAKLFFIFCVVLGHVLTGYEADSPGLQCIRFYIYLFHIPGFVFLSGLFAKSSVRDSRWDKAASFVMLFLFMTVVRYACAILRKASPVWDLLYVTDVRWYALGMFFWYAAAILLKKADPRRVMAASVLLSMAAGYVSGRFVNAFALLRVVNFFPFFYAGLLTDPERLTERLGNKRIRTVSALLVLAVGAVVLLKIRGLNPWLSLFRGSKTYGQIDTVFPVWSGAFWRLGAILASSSVLLAWISLMPGKQLPGISSLGKRTLPVYAFHSPVYKTILYFIPILDEWIRQFPVVLCLVYSALIVLLCALPPFDRSVRKCMNLVVRKGISA